MRRPKHWSVNIRRTSPTTAVVDVTPSGATHGPVTATLVANGIEYTEPLPRWAEEVVERYFAGTAPGLDGRSA